MNALPSAISALPGVSTTSATSAPTARTESAQQAAAPQAIVWEGTGASAQSKERTNILTQEFDADLEQNPHLTRALTSKGLPADARGLARIAGKANRHPAEFSALAKSIAPMTSSLGKNPAAVQRFGSSLRDFTNTAAISANQMGDIGYLMLRIAEEEQKSGFSSVRSALKSQVNANKELIKALEQYERGLNDKLNALDGGGRKTTTLVESDFRLNSENEVERIADASPDSAAKGMKVGATLVASGHIEGGKKGSDGPVVEGARMSTKHPPRLVTMTRDQLIKEIAETEQQLAALRAANKTLRNQANDPPSQGDQLDSGTSAAIIAESTRQLNQA